MTSVCHLPIVVGVDGSPGSQAAARWAANEAGRREVPLILLHAYTIPIVGLPGYSARDLGDALRRAGEDLVATVAGELRAEDPKLSISTVVHDADPRHALMKLAEESALLVIGAHGDGRVAGVLVGSVAVSVAAHSPTSVVVVPLRSDPQVADSALGPVLLGIDGSESAEPAVAIAFEEATSRATDLTAILAWQPSTRAIMADDPRMIATEESDARTMLVQQLAGWSEKYPDVVIRQELVRGWPAESIVEYALALPAGHQPQLLVVGSHGRGRLANLFLSSTSQALISEAPCPVLVAR